MSVANILRGSHPRRSKAQALLAAIPMPHRADLLAAYILDDCPPRWQPILEPLLAARLAATLASDDTPAPQAQPETPPRAPSTATRARQILAAIERELNAGNTTMADWLSITGKLLADAHLPPDPGR
jgi:hypothetical protein